MPFLLAVGAFIVAVLRKPIDARLKRRYFGPLAVVTGFGLIVLGWVALCPPNVQTVYLAGEVCGVTSIT